MKSALIVLFVLLASMGPAISRSADLALGVDPMVFEFTAGPNATASGSVLVTNSGDQIEQVSARSIDWNVSTDGTVQLERPGIEHDHSLTAALHISPAEFLLRPGESRIISVVLQFEQKRARIPDSQWGGFLMEARPTSNGSIFTGATILVYNRARESQPTLKLAALSVSHGVLTAHISNPSGVYARAAGEIVVRRGDQIVYDRDVPLNAILPGGRRNVVLPLPHSLRGTFDVHFFITYGDASIDGSTHARLP